MGTQTESKQFSLNKEDAKRIGIGALVAVAGAMLTYASSVVTNTDFGIWTPIIVSLWSVVANTARKFVVGEEN